MKNFINAFIFFLIFNLNAKKIIIVRHGQGIHNVLEYYDSNPDHPNHKSANLTTKGIEQVEKSAKQLLRYGINQNNVSKVYVSPMLRTRETADILEKNRVINKEKMLIDKRITERSAGDREGKFYKEFNYDEANWDHSRAHLYNGETDEDVKDRVLPLYNELKNLKDNENILIVTHGTPALELTKLISGKYKKLDTGSFIILEMK